jgi:hypothetical protein
MSASTQSSWVKVNEATQPAWPAARKMDLVLEGWLKHRPIVGQFLLPGSRVRHLLTTPSDQSGEKLN